ncbi:hypothetical protein KKJ06_23400, partial [Xenorhabdus bovienii]
NNNKTKEIERERIDGRSTMLDDDSQQIINTRRKQKQPSSLFGIRFRTCVWVVPGSVRIPHVGVSRSPLIIDMPRAFIPWTS